MQISGHYQFWALPITGAEGDKSKDSKEKERRAIARKGMTFNRRLRKRRSNDQRFERKRADESVVLITPLADQRWAEIELITRGFCNSHVSVDMW